MNERSGRKEYLDILRFLAAILVIFNHLPGYTLYMNSSGIKQWIYLFLTMITRMNTPLFMMISGSLLLGKQESYRDLFVKRILRFACVIIIFNTIIYLIYDQRDLGRLIEGILKGGIQGSYWYLYSYLGMLFSLPLLRKIIKSFSNRDFWYILIIHFVIVSLVPCLNSIMGNWGIIIEFNTNFNLCLMIEKSIFYPVMGYYLGNIIDDNSSKRYAAIAIFASLVGIAIESIFTVWEGSRVGYTQHYVMLFDYLIAITVFYICKTICNRKSCGYKMGIIIQNVASVSFGVYLADPILKKYLYGMFEGTFEPILPTIVVSAMWCIASYGICGGITYILRRVKPIGFLI